MAEVITILVGDTGCMVGSKIWRNIAKEHAIEENTIGRRESLKNENLCSVFEEDKNGLLKPRTLFFNNSLDTLKYIRDSTPYLEKNSCTIYTKSLEEEFNEKLESGIRAQIEKCHKIDSIHVIFNAGGSIGKTAYKNIAKFARVNIKIPIFNHIIIPSKVSPVIKSDITNPKELFDGCDGTEQSNKIIFYDTDTIRNCTKSKGFSSIDSTVADVVTNLTAGNRFYGEIDCKASKVLGFENHFVPAISPKKEVVFPNPEDIILDCLNNYTLVPKDRIKFPNPNVSMIFRGNVSEFEVIKALSNTNKNYLAASYGIIEAPLLYQQQSLTMFLDFGQEFYF